MAKGSCGELRSQLVIAFDQNYIDQKEFSEINRLAMHVGGMLGALINYLKSSKVKGSKFKLQKVISIQTKEEPPDVPFFNKH
jgi:hypothetical protein